MPAPSTNRFGPQPWLRWLWLAAALATPAAAEPIAPAEPIKLFDGRSIAPFYTFVQGRGRDTDPKGVFQVVDGMLRISGEEWGCVTTREEYRDYRLVVEYRWGDETFGKRAAAARDSGLLIHSRGKDGGYGGVWMHGIEAQIIEGGTGDLLVVGDGSEEFALTATVAAEPQGKAKVYAPDGRPITIHGGRIDWWGRDPGWKDTLGFRGARDAERPVGEWNTLECVARGDTLEVSLNGVVVSRATGLKPAAGRIQIQSEGAEVFFRRVELLPLEPAKAPAAKAAAAAEPPAPAEVAAATELPADFALELAAAEPAVVDPVAITFDERGRPYVVEYRDYPQGPPPGQPALSRIVRLDDADGDGFYEGSTVVAEHVPFAQGVLAVRGGLLVTAAPDVLMLTDTDGDGRADRREVVATGFKTGNPQLRAACPQLDIDNTVSITGGLSGGVVHRPDQPAKEGVSIDRRDVRIDLARNRIEAAAGFGQFGNAFDDLGRRFTTSNRNPVIAVRLPAAALARNPYVDLGGGYEDAAPSGAASRVFPIAETRATAASHTGTHTSACGLTIFRGDLLGPDAVGDAFICEPVSHLVTRRRLRPAGAGFTSDHVGPEDREFLASRSPWFRPVFTATGPDGSLWVVDMCRSTVEHPQYMPPGLADTLDLRAGDRAGRIWRITRKGSAPRGWTPPTTAAEAAALFADPNGWRRSTAQRLLVEGRFKDAAPAVRAALAAALTAPASSTGPLAAVHALWTLQGLGALTADDVRAAAGATQAGVRETAARLAPLVDADGLAAEIAGRLVNDADAGVRLAATLAAAGSSAPPATAALRTAAAQGLRDSPRDAPRDPWIDRAVLSGAVGRAAELLDAVAAHAEAEVPLDLVEKLGATAAGSATAGGGNATANAAADAAAAAKLLAARAAAGHTGLFDVALLAGLAARQPLTGLPVPAAAIAAVVDRATAVARDPDAAPADRRAAIRLLGEAARTAAADQADPARAALVSLVGNATAAEIQAAAATNIVRSGDAAAIGSLVEAVAAGSLEPAVRHAAVTALADRRDAAGALLAAIEAGRIPATVVPLDRQAALARSPEAAVREAAGRIWKSSAVAGLSEQEFAALVTAVQQGGDVDRGRAVFMKHCAACHQAGGGGHQVGPALVEAADRPLEQIVVAIVDPSRAVEPRWESSIVVTTDGEALEGIVAESGRESIVLVRAGGERRTVPRTEIDSFRAAGRSLMPDGFGRLLKPAELADLIAFLRGGRPVPRAAAVTPPGAAAVADSRLTVGVAESDITPPSGFPMSGYYRERLSEGTIDPLKARAIVFRQQDRAAALVVCDLTSITRDLCEQVRTRAAAQTGIPAASIAVSATHSHTAPEYGSQLYRLLAAGRASAGGGDAGSPPYAEQLIERMVAAIISADRSRFEPLLTAGGAVQQTPVSFNRRSVMRDGSVQTWRPLSDPNVVRPAGPIDPEIGFLAIRSVNGTMRGVLSTFALHLDTVGGVRWSGDFPFFIEQRLRKRFGQGLVSVFGAGCCGDVNHVDPASTERNRTDVIGNALGATLEAGLSGSREIVAPFLQVRSTTVALPLLNPEPAQISRARELVTAMRAGGKVEFLDQVTAINTLILTQFRPGTRSADIENLLPWGLTHAWAGIGDALPAEVQTITLGRDVAIVTLPGEVFVELGLAIKRGSPFATTLVVELSNCNETQYIPTRAAAVGGGYESANSTLLPGGGELLVEAALRLLRESAKAVPGAVASAVAAAGVAAPAAVAAPVTAVAAVAPAGGLRAGGHVEDISPTQFPVPVNGGFKQVMAAGIEDPMQARCLVLDDGRRKLAFVTVDACMLPREIVAEAKALATRETGIPPEHILIAATHTHSAAALTPVFQCEVDAAYAASVPPRIARGIAAACRNLEPAECGWGASSVPDQVFHRRWFVRPGLSYENPFGITTDRVQMNPGAGSGLVSVPAGPVDSEVAVLGVRAVADGRPIGLVANYSLHYVGGVKPISADYFAAFATEIGRRLGADGAAAAGKPPLVAMLSNGTSGNVNNIDFGLSPKHAAGSGSRIRVVAAAVADAAEEAWQAIKWRRDLALDTASEELALGVRKGTPADIAQAKRWLDTLPRDPNGQWSDPKAVYARETLKLADYPDTVPVTLQVHRVGDLSIAAIPCEVFVETGLHLKRVAPFAQHFTVSLANGYNGYLPREPDHAHGGYETWRARSSYLEATAEAKIVAALERMLAAVAARHEAGRR